MANSGQNYHLQELAIARDTSNPRRSMPVILETDRAILDLGCGAGQTMIAANLGANRMLIGVDVDKDALALGRTLTETIWFVNAAAEAIPLSENSFDLVISWVALPYTDIPRTMREIARVLRPGGRCWLVLHPMSFGARDLVTALLGKRVKEILYRSYVLANGVLLHLTGHIVRYPLNRSRLESTQTVRGIRHALSVARLVDIAIERGSAFVVTARRDASH